MLFPFAILNRNFLLRLYFDLFLRFVPINFSRKTSTTDSDPPRKQQNSGASIPDELLAEIFKSFPAELIGRSMCICKSWRSLLSSSYFVALHYHHSLETQKPYPVLKQRPILLGTLCSLSSPSIRFRSQQSTTNPLFVAVINGVVCLTSSDQSTIVLWNPVVRKYLLIPNLPKIQDESYPDRYSLGFGFNDSTQDFSVIRLWMPLQDRKPLLYDLFSSKAGVWRKMALDGIDGDFIRPSKVFSNGCFSNGTVHWLVESLVDTNKYSLLIFDCQGEKFISLNLHNLPPLAFTNDSQVVPSASKAGLLLMDHATAQPVVSLADKNHEYLLI